MARGDGVAYVEVEDGSAVIWSLALLRRLRSRRILAQTTTARQMQRKHERQLQVPSTLGREGLLLCSRMGWLDDADELAASDDADDAAAGLDELAAATRPDKNLDLGIHTKITGPQGQGQEGQEAPAGRGRKRTRDEMTGSAALARLGRACADAVDYIWGSVASTGRAGGGDAHAELLRTVDVADVTAPGDSHRYLVFVDLWLRGYYVGDGCRYGADYVAYLEDPEECHSFAAVVVRKGSWRLTMPQMAGLTRMQNVVRKAAVFAYIDEGEEEKKKEEEKGDDEEEEEEGASRKLRIKYTSSSFLGVV